MPENGATLVEPSSLRKPGRLWTYFFRLGDCTDRHVCLHKKLTPESDRNTNAALGEFNFSFHFDV